MRYLITVSYDGTEFSGYQKQPKMRTVQGEIEKALKEISGGKKIDIHASGRTDAGVHAMAQKIHFDLDMNITLEKLAKGLNSLLPKDIFVRKVEEVSSDFHARFSAIGKEYIYILNMGEYNPLERNYVYQHNNKLDVVEMERAMKYFEGTHNFKSFTIFSSFESLKSLVKNHINNPTTINKINNKITNNIFLLFFILFSYSIIKSSLL